MVWIHVVIPAKAGMTAKMVRTPRPKKTTASSGKYPALHQTNRMQKDQ